MGVIYEAFDERLHRNVAVKCLFPTRRSDSDHDRMLREARALAKLEHPNIVPVHDAGTHEGTFFFVMALLTGQTLRTWARTEQPGWREVTRVMLGAADGLIAAHRRGLVHRDFKSDNVMMTERGVPVVMDFGLALPSTIVVPDADEELAPEQRQKALRQSSLTRTGERPGTPAYMAPEMWLGERATVRSDVFAFCVSYWELLFDSHPFGLESIDDLMSSITEGRIVAPPPNKSRNTPSWLRELLERGLQHDPQARWPSVRDLVEAIQKRWRIRRRRAVLATGAATLALAAGIAWPATHLAERNALQNCLRRDRALPDLERLRASTPAHSGASHDAALDNFERWNEIWRDTNRSVCEADAAESWSTSCLESQASAAQMLATTWEQQLGFGHQFHAPSWMQIVLSDPRVCGLLDENPGRLALNPDRLAEVRDLQARHLQAAALLDADLYGRAIELLDTTSPQVTEIGFRPLVLRQHRLMCAARSTSSDTMAFDEACSRAYDAALELEEHEMAAWVAVRLGAHLAALEQRREEAERWLDRARDAVARAEEDATPWRSTPGVHLAAEIANGASFLEANLDARIELARDPAFASMKQGFQAIFLGRIASDLLVEGALDTAEEMLRRALAVADPGSRAAISVRINLAVVLQQRGRVASGLAEFERARDDAGTLEIPRDDPFMEFIATLDAEFRSNVEAMTDHAIAFESALDSLETKLGREHVWVGSRRVALARVQRHLGLQTRHQRTIRAALLLLERPVNSDLAQLILAEGLQYLPSEERSAASRELDEALGDSEPGTRARTAAADAWSLLQAGELDLAERFARAATEQVTKDALVTGEAAWVLTLVSDARPGDDTLQTFATSQAALALSRFDERPADLATKLQRWLESRSQ